MRHRPWFVIPLCLAALVLLLAGCQPSSRGLGLGGPLYTKRQVAVRAEPGPNGPTVVLVGPNAQVTVLETRSGYSRIGIDDGRIEGWVETDALSAAPVQETAPSRRRAPATTPRPRPAAKMPAEQAQPAAQQPASATPAAGPEPTAPAPAAAVAPPSPTAPAPAETPSARATQPATGVLSPGEAQAAPPPPAKKPAATKKPAPATGKQAQPDAFDPF